MSYAQAIYDTVCATRSIAVEQHGDAVMLIVRDQLHVALAIQRSLLAPVLKDRTNLQPVDEADADPRGHNEHAKDGLRRDQVHVNSLLESKRAIDKVGGVVGVPENPKKTRVAAVTTVPTAPARKTKDGGKQRAESVLQTPSHGGAGPSPTAQTNSNNLSKDPRAPTQHQLAETNKARKNAQKTALAEGTAPQKSKLIATRAKGDGSGTKAVPRLKRLAQTVELEILHVAKKLSIYKQLLNNTHRKREISAERVSG
ncbi:hypothetical protein K438DRAFT_1959719 [Mycena galopus ATCC 62051]|nr:hypothetical protein K438DRAFT_1959719 [Mycena galopus ATCC 62051]